MNRLKEIRDMIFYNFKPLAGFELIYKLASAVVFVPFIWHLFDVIMNVSGYSYLTFENIGRFLLNPLTLLALLLLFLIATVYAMIDISAVVFVMDQSAQRNAVRLWDIIKFALKNSLRAMRPENLPLILVVLLLMPLMNIGMASSFLSTISIPDFIMDYISANHILAVLYFALVLLLALIMTQWLYVFHYFTLEGCSFIEAQRRSGHLSGKKRFLDFAAIVIVRAAFTALYQVFIFLAVPFGTMIGNLLSDIFILKWIASTAVWMVIVILMTVCVALTLPVSYSFISMLFYRRKAEAKEAVIHSEVPERRKSAKHSHLIRRLNSAFVGIVILGSLTLGFLLCSGRLNPQIEYVRTMEVTAHRGASAFYPENTMAAFEGAKRLGADWIELDVQQTKDGEIIVLHDTNLKRTTGLDANTWELNYSEISVLDAGSYFNPEFKGERIPLLKEVVKFAKENDIRLNIELKPTGHEVSFEKCVIDIIKETGLEDSCVITSLTYEVLERVKEYDPTITTVYVTSLAYGDINKLTAADNFSVEATSATKALISRVHNSGKQLYAWTVNTQEGITKMAELNVDNIITDNIELAKQCIYESRYSSLIEEYIQLFSK